MPHTNMLQSRPMWARKVGPSYGGTTQVLQTSTSTLRTQKPRRISHQVHCSAQAASPTKTTLHESSDVTTHQKPISVIRKIRESLVTREKTAVNITENYLTRLQEREPHIRSFLHLSENALQDAQELDKKIANGVELGLLAGVPLGVKDNFCTRDMPATGGSQILRGYCPPFDATSVCKLREEGAVLVGKTNMDEFGMGSSTEGSAYQVR